MKVEGVGKRINSKRGGNGGRACPRERENKHGGGVKEGGSFAWPRKRNYPPSLGKRKGKKKISLGG